MVAVCVLTRTNKTQSDSSSNTCAAESQQPNWTRLCICTTISNFTFAHFKHAGKTRQTQSALRHLCALPSRFSSLFCSLTFTSVTAVTRLPLRFLRFIVNWLTDWQTDDTSQRLSTDMQYEHVRHIQKNHHQIVFSSVAQQPSSDQASSLLRFLDHTHTHAHSVGMF